MLRVSGPFFRQVFVAASGLAMFVFAGSLAGQQAPGQSASQPGLGADAVKTYGSTGQLTVQVQDTTGAPFFEGATVTLLTREIDEKLSMKSDQAGRVRFTALPVGQYLIEIVAPGYRTVQEQVLISGTREAQDIVVSMVPKISDVKAKGSAVSTKAVKETERALRSLQLDNLNDAHKHLLLALVIDPNFADANYLMGLLLLRRKDAGQAAAYLQKSVTASPNHAPALLALGEAQYLDHDYSQASESLEKFLREQPNGSQAAVAQKYVNAMYKLRLAKASGDAETAGGSLPSAGGDLNSNAGTDNLDLPPLPDIPPVTETNWAPPDVDEEKIDLTPTDGCQLNEIIQSAGNRVRELVQNVDHFTATENLEHSNVSPMGLRTSHEIRKFDYLVEIHPVGEGDLNVEEYRNGSVSMQEFPEHIATVGLPTLALIFHPYLRPKYEFQCEGRGSWHGKAAWVVHFQQRSDRNSGMLVYHVGHRFVAVGLKGRAWIDVDTSQIVAMESDIMKQIPEIKLFRDHQLVEYGPVSFRNNSSQLWLPKSADWYCSISGRRFYRRHTFSQFLLFSVDDKQRISAPKEPVEPDPQ
jgi:hypothetical protein